MQASGTLGNGLLLVKARSLRSHSTNVCSSVWPLLGGSNTKQQLSCSMYQLVGTALRGAAPQTALVLVPRGPLLAHGGQPGAVGGSGGRGRELGTPRGAPAGADRPMPRPRRNVGRLDVVTGASAGAAAQARKAEADARKALSGALPSIQARITSTT